MKFLLFSLAGGLVMLVAVIARLRSRARAARPASWSSIAHRAADGCRPPSGWLFVGFFIAFAVKAPMWPSTPGCPTRPRPRRRPRAALLVGVLDKVGTYGMIRFCLQLFPDASQWATPVVIALALISIVYGGLRGDRADTT